MNSLVDYLYTLPVTDLEFLLSQPNKEYDDSITQCIRAVLEDKQRKG